MISSLPDEIAQCMEEGLFALLTASFISGAP